MKRIILTVFVLTVFVNIYGQKSNDTKIIITLLGDTTDIYKVVKLALIDNDFIIKDNGNKNMITTYPRELKNMAGFATVQVEIKGSAIELTGLYSLKTQDYFGNTKAPKDFTKISYFKSSKTWSVLKSIAIKIGDKITYTQN